MVSGATELKVMAADPSTEQKMLRNGGGAVSESSATSAPPVNRVLFSSRLLPHTESEAQLIESPVTPGGLSEEDEDSSKRVYFRRPSADPLETVAAAVRKLSGNLASHGDHHHHHHPHQYAKEDRLVVDGGAVTEDESNSTRSSYIESPSTDVDPETLFSRPESSGDDDQREDYHHHQHQPSLSPLVVRHNEKLQVDSSFGSPLGFSSSADSSTIMLDQPEESGGGYLNKSFSNLSDHVMEAGLPAVIVIDGGEDGQPVKGQDGDSPGVEIILAPSGHHLPGKEGLQTLVLQIFIPFLLAGCGMVGAGILLDKAQNWEVFVELTEIFIMVPALLGLKGNLEMTLASRLSTQVNIGGFEDPRRKWRIIGCNVALNQVLATGVGFLASIFAVVVYAINHGGGVVPRNVLLLLGTALISACITSVVQDSVMIFIVLMARRFRLNPDNIATPVAGMIGDVLTLGILVGFSMLYYSALKTNYWWVGPGLTIAIFASLLPMWIIIARKEPTTRHVLLHGWLPVIVAMVISSCAGIILERVLSSGKGFFKGLPVFQPLMNGVGGNIVSVQASRISTYLHVSHQIPGQVPPGYTVCRSPCDTFCSRAGVNARTARLLMLMIVPGHLVFLFLITLVHVGSTSITLRFAVVFLVMAIVQVALLLYTADILTHFVWKRGLDPDSTAIPYLTALGDLLGTGLLALGFYLLWVSGNSNDDVGD